MRKFIAVELYTSFDVHERTLVWIETDFVVQTDYASFDTPAEVTPWEELGYLRFQFLPNVPGPNVVSYYVVRYTWPEDMDHREVIAEEFEAFRTKYRRAGWNVIKNLQGDWWDAVGQYNYFMPGYPDAHFTCAGDPTGGTQG